MQIPPNLTSRERELLPYLLSGATRVEIAQAMGVSPETIKNHTKNLLDKFGATSVRDGFNDLDAYQKYYGLGGLGFESFLLSNELEYTLASDRVSAQIQRKDVIIPVLRPMTSWVRRYLFQQGKFNANFKCDVSCDYKVELTTVNGVSEYRIHFAKPLPVGKPFTVFENSALSGEYSADGGFDRISTSVPVAKRRLTYVFPDDDQPSTVDLMTRVNLFEVKFDCVKSKRHGAKFLIDVTKFVPGLMIDVAWQF